MTSMAVTASKCANASEVALLVACFMPFLPRLGHDWSSRANAQQSSNYNSEHPTLRIRLMSSPVRRISIVPSSNSNTAAI
jgi:hypothetical protein